MGNTRVVLTEEQQTDAYPVASMETAEAEKEKLLYSNIDETRAPKPAGYPEDKFTNPNGYVSKLNGNGQKIGPGIVLKVMAGDKFNIRANSWYRTNGANPESPANPLNELVAALAGGVAKAISGKYAATELINGNILSPGVGEMLNNQTATTTKPKAGLHWVLFDEQFGYVGNSSGNDFVGSDQEFKQHIVSEAVVNKNGYLYIYVSNETPNIDVFFDNLQVSHVRGSLLEETHYYPFGLTMAGISSKAASNVENKYKYNSIELNTDFDLNMYDAHFRNLDPQIGRFWQIDPKSNFFESPYAAMGNNPIINSDPLGDTAALFRPDGSFWKFQDDGKEEFSGVFYQKSTVTSTYEKDGATYEVRSYSEGVNFQFNDAASDVQALKNGVESGGAVGITGIEMMSDAKVNKQMDASGVKSSEAQNSPYSYANNQATGKMDYGVNGINRGDLDPKKFYLKGGTAYNVGDMGNYLWGMGIAQLGIPLAIAQAGGHWNNIMDGGKQKTKHYDFGPGTYGKSGFFDSPGDQRAIANGYNANPAVQEAYKKALRQLSNGMKGWKPNQN